MSPNISEILHMSLINVSLINHTVCNREGSQGVIIHVMDLMMQGASILPQISRQNATPGTMDFSAVIMQGVVFWQEI